MVVMVDVRISVIMVLRRHMGGPVLHIITLSCVHISWLLFGGWSYILITFILNLFTNCYCIGSFYFVFSCRLVDFRVYWVCWFCPGTCFGRCNLLFDCDDEAGLLCLFRWFIWMANMFTAKYLPWSLVYFSLNEAWLRLLVGGILQSFMVLIFLSVLLCGFLLKFTLGLGVDLHI